MWPSSENIALPLASSAESAVAASARMPARSAGASARQAGQRTRSIWCSTLAPSSVSGTGGKFSKEYMTISLYMFTLHPSLRNAGARVLNLWMFMHPDTHLVIQLQSLDQKISALDKEVAALPKHIAAIEKTLESHVRKLEADRAALSANQKDRKKQEGEIQIHEHKISKLKDQMLLAKTNEQYRAFQNEIDFAQNEIRKCEDRILELMTESEPLDQNVKKAESALKEEKLLVEAEKDRARKRTAEDQRALDVLRAAARRSRRQTSRGDPQGV